MNLDISARLRQMNKVSVSVCLLSGLLLAGCGGDSGTAVESQPPVQNQPPADNQPPVENPPPAGNVRLAIIGNDRNSITSPLLSLNPQGPGGSPNQSQRGGDVLQGGPADEVLIGALGVDVIFGGDGNDVMIGGAEDFTSSVDGDNNGSDNRDRAFGGNGDDVFIWAPGDGSDFIAGGPGTDVVILGVLGEERDTDGSTNGAPFFNVNPGGTPGSFDFDGVFLDTATGLPTVSVSTSPGFCTVLDQSTNPTELTTLSLDHLIRFSIRGIANDFDTGVRSDDDGLRISLHLRSMEYVVCTKRNPVAGGGDANIEVLNLTTSPPTPTSLADLPESVRQMVR